MLLTRLHTLNLGPLRGYQRVDLRPLDRDRPIILFGGKNGTGKTTLLDAVRLCLYGRRALGVRLTEQEYHTYLADKIYHGAPGTSAPRKASVGLEFEHSHSGERNVYSVERGWERRGKRVVEELLLTQDGHLLSGMDRSHWQDFLDNLIPPALAQLFFFDGERIQALAEDAEDFELATAIRGLLGLDLVEQLQTDLAIHLGRETRDAGGSIQGQITALLQERSVQAPRRARLETDRAQFRTHIEQQDHMIQRLEDQLVRDGHAFAEQRASLKAESKRLESDRSAAHEELRTLCAGLLPLAIAPDLCRRVSAALLREDQEHVAATMRAVHQQVVGTVELGLRDRALWSSTGLPDQQATALAQRLLALVSDAFVPQAAPDAPDRQIHDLAPLDSVRISTLLDRAISEAGPAARRIGSQLGTLDQRRRQVEQGLHRAPDDEVLRPHLDELAKLHHKLGTLNQQFAAVQAELKELLVAEQETERQLRQAYHEVVARGEVDRRVQLVARIQSALDDFHRALGQARLTELERTVTLCFNRLARKGDLVSRIAIDPATMRVTLFGRGDRPILKSWLSAGEKQIYAVALLWALAQVSGRKLPVIIDTPLGRLDSEHRSNLARAYFPYAAEQMIILSTDTEIDAAFAQELDPSVSRQYRLEYDPAESASHILEGYFWELAATDRPPSPATAEAPGDNNDGTIATEPIESAEPARALEPATLGG